MHFKINERRRLTAEKRNEMASGWLISAWQGRNARGLFRGPHGDHGDRGEGVSVAACDLVGPLQTPAPLAFRPHGPSAQLALPPEYVSHRSNPLLSSTPSRSPCHPTVCLPGAWRAASGLLGPAGRSFGSCRTQPSRHQEIGGSLLAASVASVAVPSWEEFAGRRKQQKTLLTSSCCPSCVSACAGGPRSRA